MPSCKISRLSYTKKGRQRESERDLLNKLRTDSTKILEFQSISFHESKCFGILNPTDMRDSWYKWDLKIRKTVAQTLLSEFSLRSVAKVLALADLTSLGDPTPLSTKSPRWPSCFCKGENVPTDLDSTMPEFGYTLVRSGTMTSISYVNNYHSA